MIGTYGSFLSQRCGVSHAVHSMCLVVALLGVLMDFVSLPLVSTPCCVVCPGCGMMVSGVFVHKTFCVATKVKAPDHLMAFLVCECAVF